jgi:opacity protein-like surface antigen
MKKLLGTALVLFAVPAFAADLNYNYLQAGYQRFDFDGASEEFDGYGIGGSFAVGDNWFIDASYGTIDLGAGVDLDTMSVGFGYHVGISDNADFYGSLSWVRADVSIAGLGSGNEDGYGATIGLRGMVGENVELTGHVNYSDLGDGADGTTVGAGLLYSFTDNFAVGIFIDVDEDATAYGGGVRLYW